MWRAFNPDTSREELAQQCKDLWSCLGTVEIVADDMFDTYEGRLTRIREAVKILHRLMKEGEDDGKV